MVVAEATATLPVDGFANATMIGALNDFLHAGDDMCVTVLAQLYHDPTTTHFMGNRTSCAGTRKGIND